MELFDWLDLLASERRLAGQGWAIRMEPCSPHDLAAGRIRNRRDQCPLCAWAELQGAGQHTVAWQFALRDIFGMDTPFGDAGLLADAADFPLAKTRLHYPEAFFARGLLLQLLDLKEPV
jgi:hypothetical protein